MTKERNEHDQYHKYNQTTREAQRWPDHQGSNGDAFADVALARKMFVNSIHQKLLQTNMYERVNRVRNDATIQHEMQHDFLGLVRRLESTR